MPLICPACKKVNLSPKTDPETRLEIDACPRCSGLWFDNDELSKFFKSSFLKEKFFLPEESAPIEATGYVISTAARQCPRCKIPMTEKLFGEVAVDICPDCFGIWLDDGELRRIVNEFERGVHGESAIESQLTGGLEKRKSRRDFSGIIESVLAFFGKE